MIGQIISHYRILDKLGEGGMSVVYRAEDLNLNRLVALKFLPPAGSSDQESRARLKQEARAAAALDHPNICPVYEIDEADGRIFIAMAYIDGPSLDRRIGQGRLEWDEILDIAIQAGLGLQEAHAAGVVHRDIKSGNIMSTAKGQVKIVDFGLARLPGEERISRPGTLIGTTAYMAPEQLQAHTADHRSDIWGFGVVLYEMAAGRVPFTGDYYQAILYSILNETPEPIREHRPEVPAEYEAIVEKALAKQPAQRYQDAGEMLEDLDALRSRLYPDARPLTGLGSGSRTGPRTLPRALAAPRRSLLIAAALAAVLLALAGIYWPAPGPAFDSLAVLPFQNVGGVPEAEYLSDGITETLINSLSRSGALRVVPRTRVFGYKGAQMSVAEIARDLQVRTVLSGRVLTRGDTLNIQVELVDAEEDSQLWGQQYERTAGDLLAVQEEISARVVEQLRLRLSNEQKSRLRRGVPESAEAYHLYLKGRYLWNRRTRDTIREAAEYFRQAIDKDPAYALAYAGLADCYALFDVYGVSPAKDSSPLTKAAARKALEIDETLAEPYTALAFTRAMHDFDWAGSERDFQRSLELDPNYANGYHWYAMTLLWQGRFEEAARLEKRAAELDPLSVVISMAVGLVPYYTRDYDGAIAQFQKTLQLDPDFPTVYYYLGKAYQKKGLYDDAISAYQKDLSLSGRRPTVLAALGNAYAASGRESDARNVLTELENLSKERPVGAIDRAVVYAGMGDKDRAFEWLDTAYAERAFPVSAIKTDPMFESLRDDPRMDKLLRRMGLLP